MVQVIPRELFLERVDEHIVDFPVPLEVSETPIIVSSSHSIAHAEHLLRWTNARHQCAMAPMRHQLPKLMCLLRNVGQELIPTTLNPVRIDSSSSTSTSSDRRLNMFRLMHWAAPSCDGPGGKHGEGDWKGCDVHQTDDGHSIAGASNGGVWSGLCETSSTNTIHSVAWDHGKCSVPGSKRVVAYATRLLCGRCTRWHYVWGRRWRRRRRGSPWRSGAGYFPRSPGCRGRCAGQGASGQRSGRRRGRTGRSRKGGRWGQREPHIMDDMAWRWRTLERLEPRGSWHNIRETRKTTK